MFLGPAHSWLLTFKSMPVVSSFHKFLLLSFYLRKSQSSFCLSPLLSHYNHTYNTSGVNHKSGCHLHLWLIGCRSWVLQTLDSLQTPSLDSINFLEELTELSESVYSRDYWFFRKDITQKQPDGRDVIEQVIGGGHIASTHSPSTCSPSQKLS